MDLRPLQNFLGVLAKDDFVSVEYFYSFHAGFRFLNPAIPEAVNSMLKALAHC